MHIFTGGTRKPPGPVFIEILELLSSDGAAGPTRVYKGDRRSPVSGGSDNNDSLFGNLLLFRHEPGYAELMVLGRD